MVVRTVDCWVALMEKPKVVQMAEHLVVLWVKMKVASMVGT